MRSLVFSSRQALRVLWRSPLRTLLMMAGVLGGVAALTILNALGEGARQETLQRFRNMLGSYDTVVIRPGGGRTRGMVALSNVPPTLKFEDARALVSDTAAVREVALLQNAFDIDVKYRDRLASPAVFGVSANWFTIRADAAASGTLLSDSDTDALARVAVLGPDVVDVLFPGEDPLGKTIHIADVPFLVKGVLQRRGAAPGGGSLDDIVVIPVSTAARRLFNRDYLTMALARVRQPDAPDAAVAAIRALLRQRHHLAPDALDDFTLTNPKAMMSRVTRMRSTLQTLLSVVALLVTLLGGAMILALMLSSVGDRRREIGVQRAIGATPADVLAQFLLESLWCAGLAGLGGVAIGALAAAITRAAGVPARIVPAALAVEIAVCIGLGVVCGLYPAWKAARIDPVHALRV